MVEEYKDRLALAMKTAGASITSLSRALGLSYQGVRKVVQGDTRSFTAENNARAAEFLGVDPNWLATGRGLAPGQPAPAEVDLDGHPDLSPVRTVKLKLQAGVSGFAVEPDTDDDGPPLFFRNDWLRKRGFKPYNLIVLRIAGLSMIDKLWPDDRVVVNTADTEPQDGEVYAINYEGESVIKRLKRDQGRWWLSSDNPDKTRFPDKQWSDDSCILIGHVIQKMSERI